MTSNQIAWYDAHTRRMAHEAQKQHDTEVRAETSRSNLARESETRRANQASEAINWQNAAIKQQQANTQDRAQDLAEKQSPSVIARNVAAAHKDYYAGERTRHELNEWLTPYNVAMRYAETTMDVLEDPIEALETFTTAVQDVSATFNNFMTGMNKGIGAARNALGMTTDLLGDLGATIIKGLF